MTNVLKPEVQTIASVERGHGETMQMLQEAGFVSMIDTFVHPCPRAFRMERIVREQATELADQYGYTNVVLVVPDMKAPFERSPIDGASIPKLFSVLVAAGVLGLER